MKQSGRVEGSQGEQQRLTAAPGQEGQKLQLGQGKPHMGTGPSCSRLLPSPWGQRSLRRGSSAASPLPAFVGALAVP